MPSTWKSRAPSKIRNASKACFYRYLSFSVRCGNFVFYNATMEACMCIVFLHWWQPKWKDAGLPYTSFSTSFSVLLQSRKLKHMAANGGNNFYSGQLGRAQPFYTVEDRSLMEACLREDLLPILEEKTKQKRQPPGRENLPQPRQPRIDQYLRARGGERLR